MKRFCSFGGGLNGISFFPFFNTSFELLSSSVDPTDGTPVFGLDSGPPKGPLKGPVDVARMVLMRASVQTRDAATREACRRSSLARLLKRQAPLRRCEEGCKKRI